MTFTSWRSLGTCTGYTEHSLSETLDGGQSFRWSRGEDGVWRGTWNRNHVELCLRDSRLEWRTPEAAKVKRSEVERYLSLGESYDMACEELPWRSDPVLAQAMENFRGLRILRQPFGETLFAFLLSSAKSIPQIKELCAKTAQAYGEEILSGVYTLPTWKRLAEIPEKELRVLKFGYRAKYVSQTAKLLAAEPGFLDELEEISYVEARSRLMELPGVGGKVADCTLLFGGSKLEAFPVDTWIAKVMSELYELADLNLEQMATFGRIHFGRYAGLAQQFLFSLARQE